MADRQGLDARRGALGLIEAVLGEGRQLSDLTGPGGPLARLGPADRARAQRLAALHLRNRSRADAALRPFLRKGPPARIRTILELAAVEMLEEGEAPHGAVNAAVALVREGGKGAEGFSGLVNAVLRKVAHVTPEHWAGLPAQPLPKWLRVRLVAAWGKAAVAAMETAHQAGAPLDLTPRDPAAAEALAARAGATLLPTGSLRHKGGVQVSELPGYDEGAWWVQDAAAALAARALAPKAGERVLDLCAAPGGKTLQLAAAGARVTALDISQARLARLRENLARCKLSAEVVTADALEWSAPEPFDAVLLDAPCSATGTIRRHPDLPFIRTREAVEALIPLQSALIDRAIGFLRPGGRLVYCTCSLLPEEGERQIASALNRHPGLRPDPDAVALPGVEPRWLKPGPGLRTRSDDWADRGGIDGFYIAVLRLPA